MSENIRPSEVSEVLLRQLKDIDTSLQFDEVGTVLQVSDGVVRIYGLLNAEANELLEFENGIKAIVMNLEEDNVGAGHGLIRCSGNLVPFENSFPRNTKLYRLMTTKPGEA